MATTNVPYTHQVTLSLTSTSGKSISAPIFVTSTADFIMSKQVPVGSTNLSYATAFSFSHLNDFFAYSDQSCTLNFNSSGTPAPAIALKAGVPYYWTTASGISNPFTVNITGVLVTNPAVVIANLDMIVGWDP